MMIRIIPVVVMVERTEAQIIFLFTFRATNASMNSTKVPNAPPSVGVQVPEYMPPISARTKSTTTQRYRRE